MRLLFLLLYANFYYVATGQEPDSLLYAVQKENDPVKKAGIYLKLVTYTAQADSNKAKKYLEQAELLTPSGNKIGQAEIQNSWGYFYMPFNPAKGKEHHLAGIEILKGEHSSEAQNLRSKLWFNVSADLQRMGNSGEAMEILLNRSIPEAKKATDKIYLANNYLTVGLIFYNDNNLDKAIQYHEMALKTVGEMQKSPKTEDLYITAQIYLAETYLKKENYPLARKKLDLIEDSLKGKLTDQQYPELCHLESIYYLYTGNYKAALENANYGLKITERTGNLYQLVRLTFMKSKAQSNLGHFAEAAQTLKNLLNNEVYVKNYSSNLSTIYDELWMLQERRGNYKEALLYAKKRMEVTDSLHAHGQNEMINEMETKYRTAEKEKQIAQKELEISTKNTYLWILGLLSLLFLSSAFFIYRNLKNRKKIAEQREINLQQKLKEKERAEELEVTKAILDGEERERERVAKELHDGLGGMLAAVKMNLSNTARDVAGVQAILETCTEKLDHSIQELRLIARNLMPPSLRKLGLVSALQDFCDGLKSQQFNITFQHYDVKEEVIDENTKLVIYRIYQELITNAIKHSGGTEVLADLVQSEDQIQITVEDNGKGFETKDEKYKGLGLDNIRSRVDFLKGNMDIETNALFGTTISISFNIKNTNG